MRGGRLPGREFGRAEATGESAEQPDGSGRRVGDAKVVEIHPERHRTATRVKGAEWRGGQRPARTLCTIQRPMGRLISRFCGVSS